MLNLVYTSSPLLMTVLSLLIIIGYAIINIWSKLFKKIKFIFLAVSLLLILYATIFSRSTTTLDIELRPFYTFVLAREQPELYRTLFMNALLFVPFGITMPYTLSSHYKKRNILITVLSACIFSTMVEFLQYYFSLGRCETDDVIFNTLGAFIGTFGYILFGYLVKEFENMENKLTQLQTILCDLCANVLFDKQVDVTKNLDLDKLLGEAKHQTVYPIICTAFKKLQIENPFAEKKVYQYIANNVRVNFNHTEIANMLTANGIKYVFIKGVASASYYKEPDIRTMGDVDVLIKRSEIKAVNELLYTLGYITDEDIFKEDGHIVYKRKLDGIISICEVHFNINGIPVDLADTFENYLSTIFENSKEIDVTNKKCFVPSDFHHGIIMLLHTATHLMREGVGLRHLCDWAVFENSFSNDEFVNTYENPLKKMGLWRFAQLLSLCCEKYLGIEHKEWFGDADDELLSDIITDILNGGNFGFKDKNRYGQIKYISNRETYNVSDKTPFLQALSNINFKAKTKYKFTKKYKFLLPVAWICVIVDYIILLLTRKRKLDNMKTIKNANYRKSIYSEFELFKKNK